jgi:phosphoglycolate phosphatase
MPLNTPEMVLFDLDGTLIDTVPDFTYSVDTMLQEINLPKRGEEKVRTWVGNGIEHLVKCALTNEFNVEPATELFDKAFPLFLEIYADNVCQRSQFYDGVKEGINYLKENNFKLGCVTNKRERFTHTLLKSLGLYDKFGIVIAGDTLSKKKPDPLPLLHAAEYFGVTPASSLMVGDSKNDVNAARAAGFQVVCVSYGYTLGEDIREANPDIVIDSLAELPRLI